MTRLDISDFPTRHNYRLGLTQNHIERILAEWVGELAVPIYRGREVTGFAQDETGVGVELSDGPLLRAEYLVGCDGGRSRVRKTAGIEFPGWDPTVSWLLAEVEMAEEPKLGWHHDALGTHAMGRKENGHTVGVVLVERHIGSTSDPTLRDVREALIGVYGTDFGIHSPTYISRFTDMTRQAAAYRDRRVLLAGDAAHVHAPIGGQGLNIGVQDAVNLGWKLAQVVKQTSPESLLDTYHAERHPVGARVLRITMAQSALRRPDEHTRALGDYRFRVPRHGRASQTNRRGDVRSGRSLRPRRRGTRCSDAACPISTWSPPTARCESSPCCTMPGRCCSTSASPAASTSLHGRIAFRGSTPNTRDRGSFRPSERSRLPPPFWFGPTDMWPGWET